MPTDTGRCRWCERGVPKGAPFFMAPTLVHFEASPAGEIMHPCEAQPAAHGHPPECPVLNPPVVPRETLRCADCGLPYADFPLDVSLPDAQWLAIFGRPRGVLCANCIARRGRTYGATVMTANLDLPQTAGQAPCPRCGAPAETHTDGAPTLYCWACGYAEDKRASREADLRALHIAVNVAMRRMGVTVPACDGQGCNVCAALDAALASHPPEEGTIREAFRAGFNAHPAQGKDEPWRWGFDGNIAAGDREPEAWDAWRASAPDGGQDA